MVRVQPQLDGHVCLADRPSRSTLSKQYFAWAKMWPLTFLGLAVFLFLRSDPENWPLGPNGFWESFAVSDVLQHRVAVILVIMFGTFQWRVETNRVQSPFAPLVFPAVCALGGVILLTHTHPLG